MRKGQQKCFSKSNFDRFLMGREAKAARPASPALQPHPSLLFRSPLLLLHYSLPFSSSTSSSVSACPLSSPSVFEARSILRPTPCPPSLDSAPVQHDDLFALHRQPLARAQCRLSQARDAGALGSHLCVILTAGVGLAVFWDTQLTICSPPPRSAACSRQS